MNSELEVILYLVAAGVVVVGGIAVWIWVGVREGRKRKEANRVAGERFIHRLRHPDFNGLERRIGHPLPASFRELHADGELVMGENIVIGIANPADEGGDCFIAWIEPADTETLLSCARYAEGLFPFANTGCGDEYRINLKHADPEVVFYQHETDKQFPLGVTLSAFIKAPRREPPE